ncbi:Two-component response regulator [Parasponia andersonii]|uniref:Two-component response regulator n=1 Tax=Parasponia andersonii TaxID=3476 RepID=A0A2P5BUB0_PARAD|nr:Two-component response regulator [Parasponia andersonii]
MTVEDQRGGEYGAFDRFPVGMRVLAVDDDPICLKVLETLLRKCQYQVTTTNQAIKALKILRESRNKFDLVISDVNMPDMDGFKLLEFVGLEMDLPVIMLSAHSDTKLVMKGITHGAVDYLLKPVRIEELKNIWQHVVRRKKLDPKNQSNSQEKACHEAGEVGKGLASTVYLDSNAKLNKKRKDQGDDEEEGGEDSETENEDPSATQKRPRVVWSPELHRKFVAAVHNLTLEKAVPKKILDLMNEEGLTRENVASHLQKYRLYLKRISTEATQQASMIAALGGKDSAYMRMGTLDGFGDLQALTGSGRLSNTPLSTYTHGGMLSRLNSPAGLTLRGISSTGLIQPGNPQNFKSFNTLGKFQRSVSANQSTSLFQGIPASLELNKFQQTKSTTYIGEFSALNNPTGFAVPASFPDMRVTVGNSGTASNSSSTSLILQPNPQQTHCRGALGSQSSVRVTPLHSESFDRGISGSSNFLDHNRCNESWQVAVQSSKFPSTALPMSEPSNRGQMHSNDLGISSTTTQIGNKPNDISSASAFLAPLADSRNVQGQDGLIGHFVQTTNYRVSQGWDGQTKNYNHNLNQNFSASSSLVSSNSTMEYINQGLGQQGTVCSENFNRSILDQLNGCTSSVYGTSEIEKSVIGTKIGSSEDYFLSQAKAQDAFIQKNYESLDDIMTAMMKQEQNETILMDGEFGFDTYPLGSCI